MARNTARPEPGIATDEELREAAQSIVDALEDSLIYSINCERFGTAAGVSGDEWTEVITVRLSDKRQATKETAINDILKSGAPVRLRGLEEGDKKKLTFYPTNQQG